jgi:hypothetical protein
MKMLLVSMLFWYTSVSTRVKGALVMYQLSNSKTLLGLNIHLELKLLFAHKWTIDLALNWMFVLSSFTYDLTSTRVLKESPLDS